MAYASSVIDRHTGRHCEKQRDAAIAMTDRGHGPATACGLSMNRFKVRVRYRAGFGRLAMTASAAIHGCAFSVMDRRTSFAMTNRGLFVESAAWRSIVDEARCWIAALRSQ